MLISSNTSTVTYLVSDDSWFCWNLQLSIYLRQDGKKQNMFHHLTVSHLKFYCKPFTLCHHLLMLSLNTLANTWICFIALFFKWLKKIQVIQTLTFQDPLPFNSFHRCNISVSLCFFVSTNLANVLSRKSPIPHFPNV